MPTWYEDFFKQEQKKEARISELKTELDDMERRIFGAPQIAPVEKANAGIKPVQSTFGQNIFAKEQPTPHYEMSVETKQRQEQMLQKRKIEEAKIAHEKALKRQRKQELFAQETDRFSKYIIYSMKDMTYEEMRDNAVKMLELPAVITKLNEIYTKTTAAHIDDIDARMIVRKALVKVIEYAAEQIELRHREFPPVEQQKTMSFSG